MPLREAYAPRQKTSSTLPTSRSASSYGCATKAS